jgi:putative peptidoglycan lipid II flippase
MAYLLGSVTVLSGFTQCAWFWVLLRPHVAWTRAYDAARPAGARMLRRFVPVLIGLGTLQINTFLDILMAMWPIWVGPTLLGQRYPMDDKSNSILSFTQRLYQFPLGVFGIAVATAVFPMLSRHADEPAHFTHTLRRGLRLSLFIGLPASLGLILVRDDLTAVLFGGKTGFGAPELARSAAVLAGFAPAVWAYSLNHVFTRAFYAKGDTRTPMSVAIAMVGLNLALNLALIWRFREAGLAWATAASASVQCAVLGLLCRRKLLSERLIDAESRRGAARIIAAATLMALAVVGLRLILPPPTRWSAHVLSLAILCSTGVGAYVAASLAFRTHELRWLLRLR